MLCSFWAWGATPARQDSWGMAYAQEITKAPPQKPRPNFCTTHLLRPGHPNTWEHSLRLNACPQQGSGRLLPGWRVRCRQIQGSKAAELPCLTPASRARELRPQGHFTGQGSPVQAVSILLTLGLVAPHFPLNTRHGG
jgi:hypothetical protein